VFFVQYCPQLSFQVLYYDFWPFEQKYQQSIVFIVELIDYASSLLPFLSLGILAATHYLSEHHIAILEFVIVILSFFFFLYFSSLYVFANTSIFQP